MPPFVAQLWAWVVANPMIAAGLAAAVYAYFTKRITFQGLLQELAKDLAVIFGPKPPVVPPVVPPIVPPAPQPLSDLLQQLIALLLQAKSSGDTETEQAVLKVLGSLKGA